MTFEEWWKEMKPAECDELKEHFVDCWQARDAEIAALREQVTLLLVQNRQLKKALIGWRQRAFPGTEQHAVVERDFPEALAATEQKEIPE